MSFAESLRSTRNDEMVMDFYNKGTTNCEVIAIMYVEECVKKIKQRVKRDNFKGYNGLEIDGLKKFFNIPVEINSVITQMCALQHGCNFEIGFWVEVKKQLTAKLKWLGFQNIQMNYMDKKCNDLAIEVSW